MTRPDFGRIDRVLAECDARNLPPLQLTGVTAEHQHSWGTLCGEAGRSADVAGSEPGNVPDGIGTPGFALRQSALTVPDQLADTAEDSTPHKRARRRVLGWLRRRT